MFEVSKKYLKLLTFQNVYYTFLEKNVCTIHLFIFYNKTW